MSGNVVHLHKDTDPSAEPSPVTTLTVVPDPDCPGCEGVGGIERGYGDYDTGEYAGTEWYPCDCWTEWRRVLLPLPRLPRLLRRRVAQRDPWSDEPPF